MKKSRRKFKNTLKQTIMKTQPLKILGSCESSAQREIYSNTGLSQKRRKIPNGQLNPPPKQIRNRRTKKT